MPARRRKSFWRWEPLPYLIVLILLVITSSVPPSSAPVLFCISAVVTAAVTVTFVAMWIAQARRPNPNPNTSGDLSTLDGLTILDAAPSDGPKVPVEGVRHHQSAIEATQAFAAGAGQAVTAVLVPGAARLLTLRLRVSVQLISAERIHHAGYLPERADDRWQDDLARLRESGIFVRVPAAVRGGARSFTVELDLGELAAAVGTAVAQPPSS